MGAHPGHPPHGGGDHQQPATHASLTRIPRLGNAGSSFLEGCHPGGSGCLLWLDRRVWDLSQRLPSPADSLDWPALPPHCPRACPPPPPHHSITTPGKRFPPWMAPPWSCCPTTSGGALTAHQPRSSCPAMQDAVTLQTVFP